MSEDFVDWPECGCRPNHTPGPTLNVPCPCRCHPENRDEDEGDSE